MKILRLAILSIAASLTLVSTAQTTQKLTAGKQNEYGLIYTLPSTVIDVTIEARKTVKQPGEFYQYAGKYLNLTPISKPATSYELVSVTLSQHGTPNTEQRYLIQFKSGSTPYIIVDNQNFPLTINTSETFNPAMPKLPVAVEAKPSILELPVAQQAITAEMLQSPSSAKRAELAAARIFELRQSRSDIISGDADNMPSDGQAMQLALDNLADQEAALTAMFVGTTKTSIETATFSITPPADGNDWRDVIARLSATEGIVSPDNLAGTPIYLNIKISSKGELPKNEKGEEKRFPKGGLAYCIPGQAVVSVQYKGNTLVSESMDIAQYGIVFGLDPNLFTDKKAPAYAIFNPITGAITELGTMPTTR